MTLSANAQLATITVWDTGEAELERADLASSQVHLNTGSSRQSRVSSVRFQDSCNGYDLQRNEQTAL
ncbi:hypothetical protein ACFPC0_20425 [Streptomyces andamanensis]|uniref:Uncharacterized protein n=1 Tax=Streptomyces andamanensis TaxID=1565035 RepID=A0ABV8THI2_9ACTN